MPFRTDPFRSRAHAATLGQADGGDDGGVVGLRPRGGDPDGQAGGEPRPGRSRRGGPAGGRAREVEEGGGHALVVPTDVAEWPQVEHLAAAAVEHFGRIDTWVNDAGIGIGGLVADTEVAEMERLIRVNLMGTIHGVKAALPYMKRQGAGAFINIGSVVGIRSFPLQATYSASKHGVKGFTEALRMELVREPGAFHVTYIAPAAINTPFFPDARSHLGTEVGAPDPVYDPEVVAESIVFAAEHPRRDIFVGGYGKLLDIMQRISPQLVDFQLLQVDDAEAKLQADGPQEEGADNMFSPADDLGPVHGGYDDRSLSGSFFTRTFEWYPALKPVALGAAALGAFALIRSLTSDPNPRTRIAKETGRKLAKTARATAKRWL